MSQIQKMKADELHFDLINPRLAEFPQETDEMSILKLLWKEMDIKELVMSILANGFFEHEPLYIINEVGKWVVIEGNRRLAAIKSILSPGEIAGMAPFEHAITSELQASIANNVPVVIMDSRESAWRFIGFKHVKGAAKWDSYAKAKYISYVHREFGVSISNIADQIGDAKKTVLRLYRGLSIIEQAERMTAFSREDVYYGRIYFSHLYTALSYDGYSSFLSLRQDGDELIVPEDHAPQLLMVMRWIFGSESQKIEPIVRKQNPDLRRLGQVLLNPESVQVLVSTNNLDRAYDNSLDSNDVLRSCIVEAKLKVEDATLKMSVFNGEKDAMELCISLAHAVDSLFNGMKAIYEKGKADLKDKYVID